jgi:hypothetical protein
MWDMQYGLPIGISRRFAVSGWNKNGGILCGLIFFDAILHRFDSRLIAFRKRFEG